MVIRYGIIADIHGTDTPLDELIEKMTNEGVDAWILNGDIGDNKQIMYNALKRMGETQKPVYVQPGCHETVLDYFDAFDDAKEQYSNLHNILDMDTPKLDAEDHNLIFLPGSDYGPGGQFIQAESNLEDGIYLDVAELGYTRKIKRSQLEIIRKFKSAIEYLRHISNPKSLENVTKESDNTLLFNHIPCRFNKEGSVDYAHFLEGYILSNDGKSYKTVGKRPAVDKDKLNELSIKVVEIPEHNNDKEKIDKIKASLIDNKTSLFYIEKKSPEGNQGLKKIYQDLGIQKVISNHIHEAGHNAHNWNENPISMDTYSPSLFYNAGCAADGKAGIISIDGNKVAYKNINL